MRLVAPVRTGSRTEGRSRPAPIAPSSPRLSEHAVDPVADRVGDLEPRVGLAELLQLRVQVVDQRREVLDEPQDLVEQRRQREREELDDRGDHDHVHDQDRERARHAQANEPADRRIEQVDEEQADDERADGVGGHREHEPEDNGGADRMATRGESGANRRAEPSGSGWANGRWRQCRRPARRRKRLDADPRPGPVDRRPSVGRWPAPGAAAPSRTGWAGSSMVPQTSRRGASLSAGSERGRRRRRADRGRAGRGPVEPPRQRWRLVLARAADAPQIAGRELADAWETTLEASGLPVHRPAGRVRGRVAFAAPLPLGVAAERELADVLLAERVPIWRVREALADRLPAGWTLVDLFDVWVAGPPLAGRVVAADYRVEVAAGRGPCGAWRRRLARCSTPGSCPGRGRRAMDVVTYDLRRLLVDVPVDAGRRNHDPGADQDPSGAWDRAARGGHRRAR